jgi:lambda family phage tail tape measure protein
VNPLVGVKALEDLARELAMERELIGLVGFERQVRQELGKLKIDMERQHVDLQSKEAQNVLALAEAQVRELETLKSKANVLREVSDRHQELANEKALIGLYGAEREVQKDLGQLRNELLTKKVDLNDRDVARALATAETDLREMESIKEKNNLYDRLLTQDKEREMHARFLGELLRDNLITEKQYNRSMREAAQGTNTLAGAAEGLARPFQEIDTSISAAAFQIGTNLIQSLDQAADAMASFALSGFKSFSDFRRGLADILQSISQMILQVIIKMLLMRAIEAGISGIGGMLGSAVTPAAAGGAQVFGGSMTGGTFEAMAGGGDVTGGRSYLVGERGPEIFRPRSSGQIVPNGGGAYPAPIVNITNVRDPDEISSALSSAKCRDAILNVIGSNKTAVKGMLT